jgi:hypothetical protein
VDEEVELLLKPNTARIRTGDAAREVRPGLRQQSEPSPRIGKVANMSDCPRCDEAERELDDKVEAGVEAGTPLHYLTTYICRAVRSEVGSGEFTPIDQVLDCVLTATLEDIDDDERPSEEALATMVTALAALYADRSVGHKASPGAVAADLHTMVDIAWRRIERRRENRTIAEMEENLLSHEERAERDAAWRRWIEQARRQRREEFGEEGEG